MAGIDVEVAVNNAPDLGFAEAVIVACRWEGSLAYNCIVCPFLSIVCMASPLRISSAIRHKPRKLVTPDCVEQLKASIEGRPCYGPDCVA